MILAGRGQPALIVPDTAFYRHPHGPSSQDTPEQPGHLRMAELAEGLADMLPRLADDEALRR